MLDLFGNTVILHSTDVVVPKGVRPGFSPLFALADAYYANDKRELWSLYIRFLDEGYSPDEVVPIVWWGLKSALMVSKNYSESIKPFVMKKISAVVRARGGEQIETDAYDFLQAISCGRSGGLALSLSVEQWILSL